MACLAPSSSGLGRRPLKPKTGVRLPLGLLHREVRRGRRSSMAEQGTHKPLVPSSNLGVATFGLVFSSSMAMTRIITPISWVAAPPWLTIPEACRLSGHDEATVNWLIREGGVDARRDGDTWLIDKWALHDYQETLLEVLQWDD